MVVIDLSKDRKLEMAKFLPVTLIQARSESSTTLSGRVSFSRSNLNKRYNYCTVRGFFKN